MPTHPPTYPPAASLRRRRFQDPWARIISGEDEGVYGWIALNYLAGAFNGSAPTAAQLRRGRGAAPSTASGEQGRGASEEGEEEEEEGEEGQGGSGDGSGGDSGARPPTVGVLDLGGSSLEVAFELSGAAEAAAALRQDTGARLTPGWCCLGRRCCAWHLRPKAVLASLRPCCR